jgi:thioredoxin reductase
MSTSLPGAFACGDVTGSTPQMGVAIGEGMLAGLGAHA